MKQILFSFLVLLSMGLWAQTKLGFKFAPVIASNRVTNDSLTFKENGSSFKLSIGLMVDKPITDTYFFSSGIMYIPKQITFKRDKLAEEYKSHYLQIPVSLKLFTNELTPDLKAYLQIGVGLEIKVYDEPLEPGFDAIDSFSPVDLPVILGLGVEFRAGLSTLVFGGITYQRGLINTVSETTIPDLDDLQIRHTIVSLDLGIKF